jgi:hypothetical protein
MRALSPQARPANGGICKEFVNVGLDSIPMGAWYWIGVATGLGVAAGIVIGALLPTGRLGPIAGLAALLGVGAGIGIGLLVGGWAEATGGGVGGLLGALSSLPIVAGALRGGGTRFGVAAIVVLAAVGVAALAFVPGLGYAEAVLVPLFAHRMRRRGDRRYAGLRILAKD